jgi:hypothetical protein
MSPEVLLIVGAVGLLGSLILLFVGLQMLREERAKKEAAEAAPKPAELNESGEPVAPALEAAPTPAKPATNSLASFTGRLGLGPRPKDSAHEVLRVLRDNLTGRLVIEMGGRRYGQPADVDDAAVYQGLLTTLRDLNSFAGLESAPAGEAAQRPATPALSEPRTAPPAARPATPLPPRTATSAAPTPAKPLPPPSMNPFKQMQVLRELAKIPVAPTLTIAEQIDEVLQARLLGTPLVHRNIRMRPGPRGDAIFELEGQSYNSVDEVPDAEVRDLIRSAIAAWESK